MTGGTHSQGAFSKLLIEPGATSPGNPHTFDASSEIYEYLLEGIKKYEYIVGGGEMTGSRSRRFERTRLAAHEVRGPIEKFISPGELEFLLVHMHGSVTTPTETIPYFGILCDRDEGIFRYNDCKVARWVLRGRAAEVGEHNDADLLTLRLDIMGSDEVGPNDTDPPSWPGSPPTLGTTAAYNPMVFSDTDGAVTIKGAVRAIQEFVVVCNHRMYARTVNSLAPHSLCARDRIIKATFRLPWNSTYSSLYASDLAGAAASIVISNSATTSTTLTFDKLQIPRQSPAANRGREEIGLILDGQLTDSGGDSDELSFINDATV